MLSITHIVEGRWVRLNAPHFGKCVYLYRLVGSTTAMTQCDRTVQFRYVESQAPPDVVSAMLSSYQWAMQWL